MWAHFRGGLSDGQLDHHQSQTFTLGVLVLHSQFIGRKDPASLRGLEVKPPTRRKMSEAEVLNEPSTSIRTAPIKM
jgi:hypothetical protein